MSGIAGIIHFGGGPVDIRRVREMTSTMVTRGPDGIRHWSSGNVALGHCMLVTTPEALNETQPLKNEDGSLVLVMDGRVDNWEELRATLISRGARLRTRSDAELVLRAFETWGDDCLPWIDGDFAFVIWDARRRRAFCARDRTGAKPFVYSWDGTQLIFASEIRAVLLAMEAREVNEGFLAETLAASWSSRDETLWRGVSRLVAGRSMVVDDRGRSIKPYWHPERLPLIRYKNDAEYIDHYREVFFDAVRRHCRSHKTVGVEVSGGLDSSSIFAVANELSKSQRLPAPDIHGYTLAFHEGSDADELDFARAVGAYLRRSIEEVPPAQRPLGCYQQQAIRHATIPSIPNGFMHLSEYEALQSAGGRVMLNGLGGDQWLAFADNDLAESVQYREWQSLIESVARDATAFGIRHTSFRVLRHGIYPLFPEGLRARVRWLRNIRYGGLRDGGWWLSPEMKTQFYNRRDRAEKSNGNLRIGLRERLMSLNGARPAMNIEMMNGLASSAGMEIRAPLMSRSYLEFVLGLPLSTLRRHNITRFVHRQAMADLLPEKVCNRTSKAEFSCVWDDCKSALIDMDAPSRHPASNWLSDDGFTQTQFDVATGYDGNDRWPMGMLFLLSICQSIMLHNESLRETGIEVGNDANL